MAIDYSRSASIPAQTSSVYDAVTTTTAIEAITSHKFLVSSLVILLSLLILEQTVYRSKKQGLPGKQWKIPVVGAFLDSMNPTMEGYQKQWDLGPLSVVSVFHM